MIPHLSSSGPLKDVSYFQQSMCGGSGPGLSAHLGFPVFHRQGLTEALVPRGGPGERTPAPQ